MRHEKQVEERREKYIEELNAKQRNTVWPDPLANSRSVDRFLWNGSPDAPLVQRIAAWIFGILFIMVGVSFVGIAYQHDSLVVGILSLGWFFIGVKVFRNGFQRRWATKKQL